MWLQANLYPGLKYVLWSHCLPCSWLCILSTGPILVCFPLKVQAACRECLGLQQASLLLTRIEKNWWPQILSKSHQVHWSRCLDHCHFWNQLLWPWEWGLRKAEASQSSPWSRSYPCHRTENSGQHMTEGALAAAPGRQ